MSPQFGSSEAPPAITQPVHPLTALLIPISRDERYPTRTGSILIDGSTDYFSSDYAVDFIPICFILSVLDSADALKRVPLNQNRSTISISQSTNSISNMDISQTHNFSI